MARPLSEFLTDLSSDETMLESYKQNPAKIIDESDLDEEDKDLLRKGDAKGVKQKISEGEVKMAGVIVIAIVIVT